jgi:hypothetical protein
MRFIDADGLFCGSGFEDFVEETELSFFESLFRLSSARKREKDCWCYWKQWPGRKRVHYNMGIVAFSPLPTASFT